MDTSTLIPYFSTETDAKMAALMVKSFEAGMASKTGEVESAKNPSKSAEAQVKCCNESQPVCRCDIHAVVKDVDVQVGKLMKLLNHVRGLVKGNKFDNNSGCSNCWEARYEISRVDKGNGSVPSSRANARGDSGYTSANEDEPTVQTVINRKPKKGRPCAYARKREHNEDELPGLIASDVRAIHGDLASPGTNIAPEDDDGGRGNLASPNSADQSSASLPTNPQPSATGSETAVKVTNTPGLGQSADTTVGFESAAREQATNDEEANENAAKDKVPEEKDAWKQVLKIQMSYDAQLSQASKDLLAAENAPAAQSSEDNNLLTEELLPHHSVQQHPRLAQLDEASDGQAPNETDHAFAQCAIIPTASWDNSEEPDTSRDSHTVESNFDQPRTRSRQGLSRRRVRPRQQIALTPPRLSPDLLAPRQQPRPPQGLTRRLPAPQQLRRCPPGLLRQKADCLPISGPNHHGAGHEYTIPSQGDAAVYINGPPFVASQVKTPPGLPRGIPRVINCNPVISQVAPAPEAPSTPPHRIRAAYVPGYTPDNHIIFVKEEKFEDLTGIHTQREFINGFKHVPDEIKGTFGKPQKGLKQRLRIPADAFLKPLPGGEHPNTEWRRGTRYVRNMKSSRSVGVDQWDAALPTFPSSAKVRRNIF